MRTLHRAIVTGATGAVGTALVRVLAERDIAVTVLCRPGSVRRENIPQHPRVRVCFADLTRLREAAVELDDSCDAFFHLAWTGTVGAARNDMFQQNKNVEYALEAVELAASLGCKIFVGAGSQAEYGRVEGKLCADTPVFPENGYGIAKLCAGQMTRIACAQKGIQHVWARILSVYGPYDNPNSMVMSGISALLRGECPRYTPGEQEWDYLYSEDAAQALLLMAEKGKSGMVYPLGSGQTQRLKNYIAAIRDAVNPALPVALGALPYPENQVMYLCADISSLTQDVGFRPRVSFEDGIQKTVDWAKGR